MPYRRTEKVNARLAARRETILQAATEIVRRDGMAALSTDAVAARANLAVGTIYLYFADKVELVAALAAGRLAGDLTAIAELADCAPDPIAGLSSAVKVLVHRYASDMRLAVAMLDVPAYRVGLRREIERKISAAVRLHLIPETNPTIQAEAILGAIGAVTALGERPKMSEPVLTAMALRGIGADVPSGILLRTA